MTPIEEAKELWRKCGDLAFPLTVGERVQIANSFKAMIELAEQAEGFEAFKREVSDAVDKVRDIWGHSAWPSGYACHHLDRFRILPESDPVLAGLALAVEDVLGTVIGDADVVALRDALEARGVKLDGGAA